MSGIEFGKGNNVQGNPYIQGSTPNIKGKTEINNVPVTDNKAIGEFGDKLLDQVQPRFVEAARIDAVDAKELTEMFAMAGIKNPKMPTVAQYASVSGHVAEATKGIDDLLTTNNTQALFDSPEFNTLNKLFGIS